MGEHLSLENMQIVIESARVTGREHEIAVRGMEICLKTQTERGDRLERQLRSLMSIVRSNLIEQCPHGCEGKYIPMMSFKRVEAIMQDIEKGLEPRTRMEAESGLMPTEPDTNGELCLNGKNQ